MKANRVATVSAISLPLRRRYPAIASDTLLVTPAPHGPKRKYGVTCHSVPLHFRGVTVQGVEAACGRLSGSLAGPARPQNTKANVATNKMPKPIIAEHTGSKAGVLNIETAQHCRARIKTANSRNTAPKDMRTRRLGSPAKRRFTPDWRP